MTLKLPNDSKTLLGINDNIPNNFNQWIISFVFFISPWVWRDFTNILTKTFIDILRYLIKISLKYLWHFRALAKTFTEIMVRFQKHFSQNFHLSFAEISNILFCESFTITGEILLKFWSLYSILLKFQEVFRHLQRF